MKPLVALFLWLTFTLSSHAFAATVGADLYAVHCTSCHGVELQGGQGPALATGDSARDRDSAALVQSIERGSPSKGMPAWAGIFTKQEIGSLAEFIVRRRDDTSHERLAAADAQEIHDIPAGVMHTELEKFRIEVVAQLGKPWGIAALPDGRLLVTEAQGGLRIIEHGRLVPSPVQNTPVGRPLDRFRRTMLDVAVHPRYEQNGWIYLTCGDSVQTPAGGTLTVVNLIRGRLRNNVWTDSEKIAQIPTNSTATGRIAFDTQRHVFITTASDAGVSLATGNEPIPLEKLLLSAPQDLRDASGKILRFNEDGSVPSDNPFVRVPEAFTPIFSIGHRNPQGIAFDTSTGKLWSSEHGPRGGDELNLIVQGHNYGWPVLTFGTRDDGISVGTEIQHEGMDQPVINWTPEVAVSGIFFYEGQQFARWRHQLLIGTLVTRDLLRVRLDGEQASLQEVVVKNVGRVRAIAADTKGDIYLAVELRTQGLILRLVSQH